ncbi:VIT1/CCC1 transporter family protein [Pedobacter sp. NJ-S-72]
MAQTHHQEKHLKSSAFISDIVIGMSDGLTVPFALAAGLSGAVQNNAIIITAQGSQKLLPGVLLWGLVDI